MKIEIDPDLCQGHGQCQDAAPTVFEVGDDGLSHIIGDVIGPDLEEQVRDAAGRCPVEAILLHEQ